MPWILVAICVVLLCGLLAAVAYREARNETQLPPQHRRGLFVMAAFFAFLPAPFLCAAAIAVVLFSGYCEEDYESSCTSDSLWLLSLPLLAAAIPFFFFAVKSARAARRS
jgi:hypothetical protein